LLQPPAPATAKLVIRGVGQSDPAPPCAGYPADSVPAITERRHLPAVGNISRRRMLDHEHLRAGGDLA